MSTPSSPQDAFVHGQLINLVRTGRARTRPGLEQETGLGRKLVAQRVQVIDRVLVDRIAHVRPRQRRHDAVGAALHEQRLRHRHPLEPLRRGSPP